MTAELTLTETLKSLGYTHRSLNGSLYRREILRADGSVAFTGDVGETWAWVQRLESGAGVKPSPFLSHRLIARLSPLRQGNLKRRLRMDLEAAQDGETSTGTPIPAERRAAVVSRLERMLGRLAAVAT